MKEKSPEFEIIFEGKVLKKVKGWKTFEKEMRNIIDKLGKEKYKEYATSSSGYRGYYIYFNEELLLSKVLAWRTCTGFVDKNGEIIYHGDIIACGSKDEDLYYLNHYSGFGNKTGYYIRPLYGKSRDESITAKEISERFVVIHRIYPDIPGIK